MSRRIYILLAMFIVLCGTALPAHAQQSAQEILSSLNTTLESVSYSTQNPRNSSIENWNNSYQFAVIDNRFIITYRLDVTFFKGEEMQDKYFETGTYSAPLDLLTSAAVFPSSQMVDIAIVCSGEAKCFTQEFSGQYEQKGKIALSEDSKLLNRINLHLPEDLIGPTIDLLQNLLYP
jgi:hypothetical protein